MRRADQVVGALLLCFSLAYAAGAWRGYPYWSPNGPGSGFLPIWLGGTMAALAVLLLVQASRPGPPGAAFLPRGRALARLTVIVGASALFVAVMPWVGMTLGAALFLVGLLRFVEGHPWWLTLGVAVATALVNTLVFTYWLHVPFPTFLGL